jgi:Mycobacterium membrane protein
MNTMPIKIKQKAAQLVPMSAALLLVASVAPAPGLADPLPYGPDTCIQGLVWREARTGDTVCVTPAVRDRTATENANPGSNRDPLAGSGPQSCSQGYVWREAFDGDTICVTPAERSETKAANAAADSNKQANKPSTDAPQGGGQRTVSFEVFGSGEVFSIDTDPSGPRVGDHTKLPFSRTMKIAPDEDMLQVVAIGRDNPGPGCRIKVDGKVVVEQPIGGAAHCIFTFN